MYKYIIRRILLLFPTIILAGSICFFLLRVLPGDIVTVLNADGGARPADLEKLREELGFNDPIIVQYGRWLLQAVQGDLGYSVLRDQEVSDLLLDKLETTITMAILAMLVSLAVAIPAGMISAVKFARINQIPYLGICLGLQIAVIEYARNVVGLRGANSTEFDKATKYPVIGLISEWMDLE